MPQAILLKDVDQLGSKGAVVDVSKGYLRNFLIPRKLAEPATRGSIEAARQRQAAAERAVAEASQRAQDTAALLNKTVLTITHQAGDDGRLFGSVTTEDIAAAIKEARGLNIDRRHIHLAEPIKTVGTHMVTVEVAPGVTGSVKTMVTELREHLLGAGPPGRVTAAVRALAAPGAVRSGVYKKRLAK